MRIFDISEQDGPFWAAYQDYRRRNGVLDDPATVPYWFLEKQAVARVAAARCALERLGAPNAAEAWKALRRVENFLRGGGNLDEREQIVLGILGAEEAETARELAEFEGRSVT